ncbi:MULTISPECIES: glycosyltransferase family 2 protein [unclassified Rathayibacter]|uniref:glycosyltransferase family 2 protein n=1 Tax=unclassified Rathayibacter TaxID=2609250 RepID=UPI000F4B5882|nr:MULTISPECIES: glycosyltransferase family 2 protein [unclassified Rathayibacter]ROP50413.1 glycosyl transferase family 2 [Rathayibacter sp. PhB186]ROS53372.1 glycosyl transferase family 2 [Rathayibacter sp. PhB185]
MTTAVAAGTRRGRTVPVEEIDTSDATVSVLIPLHDYAQFLPAAAASALGQTGVRVQLVIVDDRSTDDSLAVARSIAAGDDRVLVLANPRNLGPVGSVLAALAVATGEFSWYLDADDVIAPGALSRAVAVARAHPSVGLVYGHPVHFPDGSVLPAARTTPTSWLLWSGGDWLHERCRTGLNVITSPEVLVRRSVLDRVGWPRPLPHTYDMELWLRLSAASDVAYIQGVDQAWHREHAGSRSDTVTPLHDLRERLLAFETFFADPGGPLDRRDELEHLARRALARDALVKGAQRFDSGGATAADLEEHLGFAHQVYGDAARLPEWERLQSRLLSAPSDRFSPRFLLERVLRRLRTDRSWRRWHREGSF